MRSIYNVNGMKTTISSTDLEEITIIKTYAENFASKEVVTETSYIPEYRGISGQVKRTLLNGAMIVQRQISIGHLLVMEVEHDFPFLKMQFELEGYSLFSSALAGVPAVEIPSGTHRLFFLPEVKGCLSYPHSRSTLEINLSVDFLNRIFSHDLSVLNQFGAAVTGMRPALLSELGMPILPEMKKCIQEIISCPYEGVLKKIYLENKVSELLMMQLFQRDNFPQLKTEIKISKKEMEKLFYVKELIEKNMKHPYTIIQLAELAGMNDCKLKRSFKQVFGHTLFGYLTDLRLSKAKLLLSGNEHNISDVSYMIGYKHSQHFTTAFKKKYGILPKELKY